MTIPVFRCSLLLCTALLMTACASGYKQFYQPAAGVTPEQIASMRLAPPPTQPIVERAQPAETQQILDAYAKRGYVLIGSSSFNSGSAESEDAAIQQGKHVGADLVLILNPKYTGSVTTSLPITTPTSSTTYTNATATAYGRSGPVTAYGSGTSTTYGTTTTYVPITVNRVDYSAGYFVRQRFGLGVFFRDLNDTERQELQKNRGSVVRLVADGTPAFNADILVGDVFVAIDGVPITNSEALGNLLRERRGQLVKLAIVRRGQSLEKVVQLNP